MTAIQLAACDYLVIGAGAASLAFLDTIWTECPTSKVVLVDPKLSPGGHWVDAYDFVHLHQPSLLYGVASRQLEGNWLKLLLGKGMLPWKHRASKKEILKYYQNFVDDKIKSGHLEWYPSCKYNFKRHDDTDTYTNNNNNNNNNIHTFSSVDGETTYRVPVNIKLVNGVLGECKIPSLCPLQFPVDDGIKVMTPNEVFHMKKRAASNHSKHYVVLGLGKTGMDTVVYLQRNLKIDPKQISWVAPNDVWMMAREAPANPWTWQAALLKHNMDETKAALALEKEEIFVRLDPKYQPTKFRFPLIGKDELHYMRQVPNVIRKGRVTAIRHDADKNKIHVEFGSDHQPWTLFYNQQPEEIVFVHCTSPGPFNGKPTDNILFNSDQHMGLSLLFAPPVPISMSVLGYLEAARCKGTLDLEFGQQLLQAKLLESSGGVEQALPAWSENDVLKELLRDILSKEGKEDDDNMFQSIVNLGLFLCLAHQDVSVGHKWLQGNRLSFLSIPGFKCEIYENICMLQSKGESLGYSKGDIAMFRLMAEKLKPLEGH